MLVVPKGLQLWTSKTFDNFTTQYYLNGNKILMQHDASNTLTFYYGVDGVIGFHLKNSLVDADYYYKKNAQNDIIGIYDTQGTLIAKYMYDAWGNQKIQYLSNILQKYVDLEDDYKYNDTSNLNRFIAYKNPFRYRSYYYDFETNLYYLNSRYYDPQLGRFINADAVNNADKSTFNGLNLYAYCINNPVMLTDSNGSSWWSDLWNGIKNFFVKAWDVIAGTIMSLGMIVGGVILMVASGGSLYNIGAMMIGAGVGGFIGGLQSKLNGGSFWAGYRGGVISGGLAALGASFGIVGAFIGGATGNLLGSLVTDGLNGEDLGNGYYWRNLIAESLTSGLISIIAWGLGESSVILKTLGFTDLFAGFTVLSEFVFSYLTDKVMEFLEIIARNIRVRI